MAWKQISDGTGGCAVGLIRKIESVQRRFTKRFPCCRHMTYNDRLVKLNIDSLELRRLRQDLVYVYKIMFGLVTTDISDYFTLQSANDYSAITVEETHTSYL